MDLHEIGARAHEAFAPVRIETTMYRNHLLELHPHGVGWKVYIFAPDANVAVDESPYTNDTSGKHMLLEDARRIVDRLLTTPKTLDT